MQKMERFNGKEIALFAVFDGKINYEWREMLEVYGFNVIELEQSKALKIGGDGLPTIGLG
jgi:N-dimethylarginine dimethylaminohydrolase